METNTINIALTDASLNTIIKFISENIFKQNEIDERIERNKIAANKEKFELAMKTMNKNGTLDKVISQIANKFLGANI